MKINNLIYENSIFSSDFKLKFVTAAIKPSSRVHACLGSPILFADISSNYICDRFSSPKKYQCLSELSDYTNPTNKLLQTDSKGSSESVMLCKKLNDDQFSNSAQSSKNKFCYDFIESSKSTERLKKYSFSTKLCSNLKLKRKMLDSTQANTSNISNNPNQRRKRLKLNHCGLTKSQIMIIILGNEKYTHLLKSFFQRIKNWIKYRRYNNIGLFFTSDNRHLITIKCLPQEQVKELVMKCVSFHSASFKEFYQTLQTKEFYPMKDSVEVSKLSSHYRFFKSIVTVEKGKIKLATLIETPKSRKHSNEECLECLADASDLKLKVITPNTIDRIKANPNCIGNFKKTRCSVYTNQTITKDNHEISLSLEDNDICARALNDLDLSLHLNNLKDKDSSRMIFDSSHVISAQELCNNECSYENSHQKLFIKEKFKSVLKTRRINIGYTNQEELLKDISVNSFDSSFNDDIED